MLLVSALIFLISVDFTIGKPNFIIMLMDDVSYNRLTLLSVRAGLILDYIISPPGLMPNYIVSPEKTIANTNSNPEP